MAKVDTKTELDHYLDLEAKATSLGRTIEEHVATLKAEVAYQRERDLKFFAARTKLRDGYSENLDLDNVDIDQVRDDLGIPAGYEGTQMIKSEVRRLKQITAQKAD
jgi:hypothetical protein